MTREITITDLLDRPDATMEEVAAGDRMVVTVGGIPVAALVPVADLEHAPIPDGWRLAGAVWVLRRGGEDVAWVQDGPGLGCSWTVRRPDGVESGRRLGGIDECKGAMERRMGEGE